MRPTALLGTLSLALYCCIFEATRSLEANGSSLPVSRIDSENSQPSVTSVIPALKNSAAGNLSHIVHTFLSKIRSADQNETYDGFEFVDSPETGTSDSTYEPNVSAHGVIGVEKSVDGARDGSSNGAVEKNSWKTYRNGTIIHDVRISLVHPANMAGIVYEGDSGGSVPAGPFESARSNQMKIDISREGRKSSSEGRAPTGYNHSANYDAKNATVIPLDLVSTSDGSSAEAVNSTEIYLASTTVLPSTGATNISAINLELETKENTSASANSFAARHMNSDGKFQPVINLGISINAKGPCFSECLTRCSKTESKNASINRAVCLPSCLPRDGSRKGEFEVGGIPDEKNASTVPSTDVPVSLLDLKEGRVFENITDSDLEMASGIQMLKIKESSEPRIGFLLEDICLSESCVLKAADIIRRLEKSSNPCNSFYNFACGGFFKNEIPGGGSYRSVFSDIPSDILSRMYSVLKSPLLDGDDLAVKLLKKLYGKCIVTRPKQLLTDALKELGGWPSPYSPTRVQQNIWGEIAFNWTYGMFLEYDLVSINLTFVNEEDKWKLNVDYPWFVKAALNSDSDSVLDNMERDIRIVASALGIDNSTATSVLADLRIFMASTIKYAKSTMPSAERQVLPLKDLRAKFAHLDVFEKLPSLLKTAVVIEDDEMIFVSNMMYLRKIDDLLRDSTVRTQASHLVLTALRTLLLLIGTATDKVREKYCVKLTGKLFPRVFGHLYASKFVSDSKVASATKIASYVRDGLLNMLDENVDASTKDKVSDRIKKLKFTWSHRNIINDDLNGIARGFDENPSFLGFVKTGIWNLKKVTYTYLHQRVNSSLASFIQRFSEDDYGVNAFYYSHNVLIPSSALHENFFNPDDPPYVSFGGLGLIVGHELLHSVTAAGDIPDLNYSNMEKCVMKQFDKFAKKHPKNRLNAFLTKDENLADYGGFRVAYRAFMEWYNNSAKETKEKRLPGLHQFNEKQMFWLSAATNWCQKVSPDFASTSVDKHAPPEFRVDGQFANIPEFARDFSCPEGSPMNPKEKCSLW